MHSRIFILQQKDHSIPKDDELTYYTLEDLFVPTEADYVVQRPKDTWEDDLKWLGQCPIFTYKKDKRNNYYLIVNTAKIYEYFDKVYDQLTDIFQQLKVSNIINPFDTLVYKLKNLLDDPYSFRFIIHVYGSYPEWYSLQEFLRHLVYPNFIKNNSDSVPKELVFKLESIYDYHI